MSAPEVIHEGCREIRARLRAMDEEARSLRAEVAAARREAYARGHDAGYAEAVEECRRRARAKGVEL